MKKIIFPLFLIAVHYSTFQAQTANVGIDTPTPGSKLTVNGSFAPAYRAITADYTMTGNDYYLVSNSATNNTVTLPAAQAVGSGNFKGRLYEIKNTHPTSTLTVVANGAELIDDIGATGLASISITPGDGVLLVNNGNTSGTTWEVVSFHSAVPTKDYDWLKGTNQVPTSPTDNNTTIYHLGGNVGIGTNAPTSKLDVDAGNIELTQNNSLRWGPDDTGERIFSNAGLGGNSGNNLHIESREYMYFIADRNNTSAAGNDVGFVWGTNTSWQDGTPTELMRLTDAGNVGIGTAVPTEKLHVNTSIANEGIALSQTALTNTVMLNSNSGGGYLGFINNSSSTDAGLTAYIQHREPNATGGAANDLAYVATNGTHHFLQPVGINTPAPAAGFWLDVAGNIQCNNIQMTAYAGTGNREIGVNAAGSVIIFPSDLRLKKEITDLDSGISKVMKLHPVYYNWKNPDEYGKQREVGFIAQEVNKVIPEVASTFKKEDGQEYNTVNYSRMVAVLTKAIQEQQAIIETQSKRISELEAKQKASASLEERLAKIEKFIEENQKK
jgi:hypothetical protein